MHPTVPFKANLQKSNTENYTDTKVFSNTLKNASFLKVDGNVTTKKKIKEQNNDSICNTNTITENNMFTQSSDRLSSIMDSNKTIGLDELMNLLKN